MAILAIYIRRISYAPGAHEPHLSSAHINQDSVTLVNPAHAPSTTTKPHIVSVQHVREPGYGVQTTR